MGKSTVVEELIKLIEFETTNNSSYAGYLTDYIIIDNKKYTIDEIVEKIRMKLSIYEKRELGSNYTLNYLKKCYENMVKSMSGSMPEKNPDKEVKKWDFVTDLDEVLGEKINITYENIIDILRRKQYFTNEYIESECSHSHKVENLDSGDRVPKRAWDPKKPESSEAYLAREILYKSKREETIENLEIIKVLLKTLNCEALINEAIDGKDTDSFIKTLRQLSQSQNLSEEKMKEFIENFNNILQAKDETKNTKNMRKRNDFVYEVVDSLGYDNSILLLRDIYGTIELHRSESDSYSIYFEKQVSDIDNLCAIIEKKNKVNPHSLEWAFASSQNIQKGDIYFEKHNEIVNLEKEIDALEKEVEKLEKESRELENEAEKLRNTKKAKFPFFKIKLDDGKKISKKELEDKIKEIDKYIEEKNAEKESIKLEINNKGNEKEEAIEELGPYNKESTKEVVDIFIERFCNEIPEHKEITSKFANEFGQRQETLREELKKEVEIWFDHKEEITRDKIIKKYIELIKEKAKYDEKLHIIKEEKTRKLFQEKIETKIKEMYDDKEGKLFPVLLKSDILKKSAANYTKKREEVLRKMYKYLCDMRAFRTNFANRNKENHINILKTLFGNDYEVNHTAKNLGHENFNSFIDGYDNDER